MSLFFFNVVKDHDLKTMIRCFFLVLLLINTKVVEGKSRERSLAEGKAPEPAKKEWLTLNGAEPLVVARGGFSGLFPESSDAANTFLKPPMSLSNVTVLCNLQLTKDGVGICTTDIRLDNSTNIGMIYPNGQSTYAINGQDLKGWFSLDYKADQLFNNVSLTQNVFSRSYLFDGEFPISTVADVMGTKPPQFWLNVQYDTFYSQHNLSVVDSLQKSVRVGVINYISSPEIGFLKDISGMVNKARTKLIFMFLNPDEVEPTTNKKYSEIMKNLAAIKSFASGIVVPKNYIFPVNSETGYLDPPTTLVTEAHEEGLEVYASGFVNDAQLSYNYSYDPSDEYLRFIDNSQFAVDGFITDFPPTASESIACFALNNVTKPVRNPLIISHNGASGIYPGNTDLAYEKAIDDGTDIIDCTVQMSKDGVAFCLSSPDLMGETTAMTSFMSRVTSIPAIQQNKGIFSFDLTWSEIQSLKPEMVSPFATDSGNFKRNPQAKNQGKFVTIDEFLKLAKTRGVTGIQINIENAAYLASKKGLSIVDVVSKALSNATFDKQSTQQVLISSHDSSVLSKFASVQAYKRVLNLKNVVSVAPKDSVEEIKKYADAVIVPRPSLISVKDGFTVAFTNVLKEMHSTKISVYVSVLRNEFVSLPFDYFADPTIELATYVRGMGVDGIVTEFPATASKYLRSPCSDLNADLPYTILPISPGDLLNIIPEQVQPPSSAPGPSLKIADIVDPPLPSVSNGSTPFGSSPVGAPNAAPSSRDKTNVANAGLSLVAAMLLCLLSI
ncbi:glycerophosphodiester phosphodiesterase GDPDL7-like [Mangifera indica]|uniref:glycerophosphodiester phosphodiesterase GDPDL7-like n=1 Tax=Mangifera indica TaxID=29780 RepID=UPI001CFA5BEB|nr:glycerophosphodiester phosphodiesterase GDPDL7-like [Mangifera indica]